jgi:DNA-binding transcriptional LysR family regulator
MELSQLRTLISVAELGSLSKAAERMRVAQPALSRQMRMLEKELGVALFTRHGRGMELTEHGRETLKHASRIVAELDEIRASATDADAPLSGQISIGLPPTVAETISVPLAAVVAKAHPAVTLRLANAYTAYLVEWLQRGDLDLAVLYDPRPARALRTRPLLLESLFVIGPPDAGFSIVRAMPFKALDGKRLLLPGVRHGLRTIVDRCAADAGVALDVKVEADSYATLKELVRHGHGWTILPLAPIHDEVVGGALTAAPLIDPAPSRRLVLSFTADRPMSRLARFAGRTIVDIVAERVERADWAGQLLAAESNEL